jgi:hypothetical protein
MTEIDTGSSVDFQSNVDNPLKILFRLCQTYITNHPDCDADYYAFGGCVRDFLCGEKPADIDFYISDQVFCENILQSLMDTGRIDGKYRKNLRYSEQFASYHISMFSNKGEIIPVDLVTKTPVKSHINCDFTCNNLLMRSDGSIGTRVKFIHRMLPFEWNMKCISDAINKNLVWMAKYPPLQSFEEKIEYSFKMEERLVKMQKKGFNYSNKSLTNFKLMIPKSHLDAATEKQPSECCPICRDNYEEASRTIMLRCGHDFHFKCIKKWKFGLNIEENTCPICRAQIHYSMKNESELESE